MDIKFRKASVAGDWCVVELPEQGLPGFVWSAVFHADDPEQTHLEGMTLGVVFDSREQVIEHLLSHGFRPVSEGVEVTRWRVEMLSRLDRKRAGLLEMCETAPFDYTLSVREVWVEGINYALHVIEVWSGQGDRESVHKFAQELANVWSASNVSVHRWVESVATFHADNLG